NRIKDLNPSADATFISTPTIGHDCWEAVYGGDEIYEWLKRQKRSSHTAVGAGSSGVTANAMQKSYEPVQVAAPVVREVPMVPAAPVRQALPVSTPVYVTPAAPVTRVSPAVPVSGKDAGGKGDGSWVNTPW
ncbi:MAG TPA: hypothetical protein VGN88_05775, partial [Phycisphaerae bacterium]